MSNCFSRSMVKSAGGGGGARTGPENCSGHPGQNCSGHPAQNCSGHPAQNCSGQPAQNPDAAYAACKPTRQVSENRARVLISRRVAAARFGHDVPPGAAATVCGAAATAGGPTATDGAGLACGEPNGCDAVATGCHTLPRRLRRPKTIPRPARSGCWRAAPFS